MTVISHPLYTLYLVLLLKKRKFNDITMIQAKLQYALADFQTVHFMKCFKQWHSCWANCLHSQEDFFEGNNAQQKVGVAIMEQSLMSGNYMTAPSIV